MRSPFVRAVESEESSAAPVRHVERHDELAMRKACEAQAFASYAHVHGCTEYARGDYDRARQWQRLAADAARGAIMYRELARMMWSAGRE